MIKKKLQLKVLFLYKLILKNVSSKCFMRNDLTQLC